MNRAAAGSRAPSLTSLRISVNTTHELVSRIDDVDERSTSDPRLPAIVRPDVAGFGKQRVVHRCRVIRMQRFCGHQQETRAVLLEQPRLPAAYVLLTGTLDHLGPRPEPFHLPKRDPGRRREHDLAAGSLR